MESRGQETHVSEVEASGGEKRGVMRYILLISLLLVIVAMSAIWIFGALRAPQGTHQAAVSGEAPAAPAT